MRLFASYIVYDGIELLEQSINQIRNQCDIIQVIYQNVSWFNKPIPKESIDILHNLKNKGIIDLLDCFNNFRPLDKSLINTPHYIKVAKQYETKKREFGLRTALNNNATHFISLDVDEFYKQEDFYFAKEIIKENNFDLTACRFINYVKSPEYHRGYDSKYVPFICKINDKSRMGVGFFIDCDPTRGITPGINTYTFNEGLLTMHHMETIRKDLKTKYESTTRLYFDRNKIDDLINNINSSTDKVNFNGIIYPSLKEQTLTKVDNYFNIKL